MENDRTPAKRLKYSPESLFAPRPQGQLNATVLPFCLGEGVPSSTADVLAGAPAASRLQPVGPGHRLTANAAPFVPRQTAQQAAAGTSSLGWQSGFGPSLFTTETHLPFADARAEDIVKHVFEDETQQANPDKGNLLHTVSGLTKQPLTDSNSVNVAANKPAASQHAGHLSIAGALPDCLFTPAKGTASKPPQGAVSATVDDENTPPHAAVDLVIRPSNGQLMLGSQPAVASTPTSIFRRLNTRSPSGSSTDLASERALTQVSGASTETPSDATCETAANGLKRARPLQRGIHPADINKRITNAQECWHILEIVENFGAGFDAVNVATALHRIAKQRPDDSQKLVASDTFKQLVMMVDIQAGQCKPQQIANIMWAFGTLSYKPSQHLIHLLAHEAVAKLAGFNPQNLANFIWAYARMDVQPAADTLRAFLAECEVKLLHFAPQNISNMLWACATLCIAPGRKFLTAVTLVSLQQLHLFTPQAVKDTLWAMATMGFTPSKPFLQGAADLCLYLIAQFNPQNIANAIWAFAKFSFNPGRELLNAMATQAMQRLPQFNSQNMSNTLWAFASLNHHPGPMLLKVLQRELIHKLPHFTAQGIENVLWAFATLGHHPGEETLLAASCHISSILGHFNHQNLALTLWAFAKLGWRPDTALLAHACQHALLTVQTINPQNLANILWAFATLEFIPTTAMLEAAALRAQEIIGDFMPQALTNLLWGFAAVSHNPGSPLLSAIADDMMTRVNEYSPQQIAVALWAFAKLETGSRPALMQAVAGHLAQRTAHYTPETLSNVMWAYATPEVYPGNAPMDAAVSFICNGLQTFDAPTLSNCLWSFAQLRHHPGAALLEGAAAVLFCLHNDCSPQAISLALVAYATFAHPDATLEKAVSTKALQMPGAFDPPAVANTLWALALLEDLSPSIWNSLLMALTRAHCLPSSLVTPKHLCQIYQAWLMLQLKPAVLKQYMQPPALLQMCQQAFMTDVKASSTSKHQAEVAQVLCDMGIKHSLNHLTADGLFCADILIQGYHVIIQVDEVHHWTANTAQPIGPTLCRDQLLMARGWTVLVVPYFQWLQLQDVPAAHETYLRQLLLGYVDVGPCDKRFELMAMGKMVDTSTDEDEASVIAYHASCTR